MSAVKRHQAAAETMGQKGRRAQAARSFVSSYLCHQLPDQAMWRCVYAEADFGSQYLGDGEQIRALCLLPGLDTKPPLFTCGFDEPQEAERLQSGSGFER